MYLSNAVCVCVRVCACVRACVRVCVVFVGCFFLSFLFEGGLRLVVTVFDGHGNTA